MRTPALLFLLGLLLHVGWAATLPGPVDWDPAAALEVAENIAGGNGAVTRATWSLALLPLAENHDGTLPAWLHWMPLPTVVILPGVALLGELGSRLTCALLAACWAPVAWLLARGLDLDQRAALVAGLLAAFAGGYARFLSTPDSIVLYGLLGSLAWLAAQRGATGGVALLAASLALTRGDGFLLAPCLGLALWPRTRLGAVLVALSGPVAAACWWGRNWLVGGDVALAMRRTAANALDLAGLVAGSQELTGPAARLDHLIAAMPMTLTVGLAVGLGLVPLLALAGAWQQRRQPVVWGALAYLVGMPIATLLAAPGVAASGTAFRSGSALFPLACALAAGVTMQLSQLATRHRGYAPAFVPGLVVAAIAFGSLGAGFKTWQARPAAVVECSALASVPAGQLVLAAEPLMVTALCDHPAVILPAGSSALAATDLADRVGATHALLAPDGAGSAGLAQGQAAITLAGWKHLGEGLYAR